MCYSIQQNIKHIIGHNYQLLSKHIIWRSEQDRRVSKSKTVFFKINSLLTKILHIIDHLKPFFLEIDSLLTKYNTHYRLLKTGF